jgi:hypothetical protein
MARAQSRMAPGGAGGRISNVGRTPAMAKGSSGRVQAKPTAPTSAPVGGVVQIYEVTNGGTGPVTATGGITPLWLDLSDTCP